MFGHHIIIKIILNNIIFIKDYFRTPFIEIIVVHSIALMQIVAQ